LATSGKIDENNLTKPLLGLETWQVKRLNN
jgi:hypothetical protein